MRKIWIDCDPGIDDAVMLACAKASEKDLKVLGISSVAGNQTTDIVTRNALNLAYLLGLDVPVVRGAREPLIQPMVCCEEVHGPTGLGYVVLEDSDKTLASEHGISYMYETIMKEEKVTLVPTGPLTNIALLLKTYPEVKEHIEELVIMGGASIVGNASATAEFNIFTDPEAAKIVFHAGLPITLCSLDVTHYCGIDLENILQLKNSGKKIESVYGEMLNFCYFQEDAAHEGLLNLHDVCTILYLTNPELFTGIKVSVDVDCNMGPNRGATMCEKRQFRDLSKCNVNLLDSVNQEEWLKILLNKIWAL
ncbi:MAG: nucleoside hydrolase [Firmicutes bacterium]|nr:nucleoside hydrolase [Bacillota bacterium]